MSRSITQCVSHLRQANPTRALTSSSHNLQTSQRQRCSEPVSIGIRHASSASSAAATSTSPSSSAKELVTWNRFFELRQTRRWANVAVSGVSTVAAISIAGPIIATSDLIMNVAQSAGLQDPIMAIGLPTIAMGGVGWLAGPLLGNLVFSLRVGKESLKDMAAKEKSFFDRIKRYRADPSTSTLSNPIPDYYGEKIGSVQDYRKWLKDQRAFSLKSKKDLL